MEAEEKAQLSFKPTINPNTEMLLNNVEYRPIYERLGEVQRSQHEEKAIQREIHV